MKIGLFFGSFNPVHIGHLILANTIAERAKMDKIWFVVSPQNPLKKQKNLLHEFDRFDMVRRAIADNDKFNVSDIEFQMPKPSYTADTLAWLTDKYPQHSFKLIIGEDNLSNFHKWKNSKAILENYGLLVYPRRGSEKSELLQHKSVVMVEAPQIDISATFIREAIKAGESIKYIVPEDVATLIRVKKFYLD